MFLNEVLLTGIFPTDALDVVEMGLYGKLGWFRRPNSKNAEFSKRMSG